MAERMRRLRDEAVYAVEQSDYGTALTKLDAARVIYDTTPNSEKDALRMEWRNIEPLIKRIEMLDRRQRGVGKVKQVTARPKRPCETSTDCYC